jgi:hypothetical protein
MFITEPPFHATRGSKSLFSTVPLAFIATSHPAIRICLRSQVSLPYWPTYYSLQEASGLGNRKEQKAGRRCKES